LKLFTNVTSKVLSIWARLRDPFARIKIPNGRLEEYEQLIAEYIRQIKDKDTGTLQFDWFINNDKTTLGG
jgi:hypothetical protein